MCRLKSGIILKDRIFIPEYNSHTEMLVELGIEDNYLNASKTFVRFELSPEDSDIFSDIDNWKLKVDQDIVPDWYDEAMYKPQVIKKVKEWAKEHIHIGIDNLMINSGINHYIKDCKNVCICGDATVRCICGRTTVKYIGDIAIVNSICDSVIVKYIEDRAVIGLICDNATIETIISTAAVQYIRDNVIVKRIGDHVIVNSICGRAIVESIYGDVTIESIRDDVIVKKICGRAIVKKISDDATIENICDDVIIIGSIFGWKNKNTSIISGNSTFKDCETKTIYQSGDWKFVSVNNANDVERE